MPGTRRLSSEDRDIAARIRSARAASGTTQRELARALGVSVQQVTKYEHAQTRVSAGQLVTIARALEVPVARLVGEDGTVSPVLRANAMTQHMRNFGALDAYLQQVVIKIVRTLALGMVHSSQPRKPTAPRSNSAVRRARR
jgi:transcriptional regulator with XRE-family HTH domain